MAFTRMFSRTFDRHAGASWALALALVVAPVVGIGVASAPAVAQTVETQAREAILVDFETGTVLLEKNSNAPMPPSSMSKLMTSLMVFERLKEGSLSLDEKFRVSPNAWRKGGAASGGSTMFLEPNTEVRVEDLLRGIIVQSGNDACIVVAENLMGSEDAFARAMTERGREIGLTGSTFLNATGLPQDGHLMTARDLVTLAHHIIVTYPEFFSLYSETRFTYNDISQSNRNPLLYTMRGADGMKTGYTSVAGYGLTATALDGDRRQILVINGLPSVKARSEEAQRLMDWGFRNFENRRLFTAGETVTTAEVWLGAEPAVGLVIEEDLRLTVPRRAARNLEVKVVYEGPVPAPVAKGQRVAALMVGGPDMETVEIPLVAADTVDRLGFMGRIGAATRHLVFGFAN